MTLAIWNPVDPTPPDAERVMLWPDPFGWEKGEPPGWFTSEQIARIYGVMAAHPNTDFVVPTAEVGRMGEFIEWWSWREDSSLSPWPLPNVIPAAIVSNQGDANRAFGVLPDRDTLYAIEEDGLPPSLFSIPATRHAVVVSDPTEEIDLPGVPAYKEASEVRFRSGLTGEHLFTRPGRGWIRHDGRGPHLSLVLARSTRPVDPDIFRSVRDQCASAGVAFWLDDWVSLLPGDYKEEPEGRGCRDGMLDGERYRGWPE